MKKIIILLYMVTSIALISLAQDCVPQFGLTTAGLYPGPLAASCVTQGTESELVITIKNFTTAGPLDAYTIDSVFIDSVTNVPCGLKYSVYPNNKKLLTGEAGCIRIHGITTDPAGQYPIKIYAKVYGTPDIPIFEGTSLALDFMGTLNSPVLDFRYWVRVKGTGACAALDTSSTSTVNKTSSCKGINNTGVNDIISSYSHLNISPNPVKNNMIVSFESDNNQEVTYTINSVSGQTIHKSTFNANSGTNQIEIDGSILNAGIYFMTLFDGKATITKKFIKE